MASTSQVRRLANVLSLLLNAGTDGERQSAINTFKKMINRHGVDTTDEQSLIGLIDIGLNGKADKVSDSVLAASSAFRRHTKTATEVREFSKAELAKHEGVKHPNLIRVLVRNATINKSLSDIEKALIQDMADRVPRKIYEDEWGQVEAMLVKMGLTDYIPEFDDTAP